MSGLAKAVERLAEARIIEAHEKEALATVEVAITERFGVALGKAEKCLWGAKAATALADTEVRRLAVADSDDGSEGHPAAKIVESAILGYAISDAIDYCRKHLPNALSLKKREFEKVAKVVKLDFVKICKEPRVRIARDLSEWLPGGQVDDARANDPMTQYEFVACLGERCPKCRAVIFLPGSLGGDPCEEACSECGARWEIKYARQLWGYKLTKDPDDV